MKTQLDERQELIQKIKCIVSEDEIRKVKIFIAGLEAGKNVKELERNRAL